MTVWPAVTAAPVPLMSGCTTSCRCGVARDLDRRFARGAEGDRGQPVGRSGSGASGARPAAWEALHIDHEQSVSSFFTFFARWSWRVRGEPLLRRARREPGAHRRPDESLQEAFGLCLRRARSRIGLEPNEEPSSAPVRPSMTRKSNRDPGPWGEGIRFPASRLGRRWRSWRTAWGTSPSASAGRSAHGHRGERDGGGGAHRRHRSASDERARRGS